MKIESIHIENFKGIIEKDLIFNKNFTILIGDNGSGKTSILDAISLGIGTCLMKTGANFGFSGKKTRPLLKDEIRKIIINPESIESTNVILSGEFIYQGESIEWYRSQMITDKSLSYKQSKELTELGITFAKNLKENINLPIFVHHTTARLWGTIYDKKTKYKKISSRLDGYYACLDTRSIENIFSSWFKTFEDQALKFDVDKTLYNAFTNAISSVVPEWRKIHFNWKLDDLTGLTEDGVWLPLKNLSDGFRSLVSLTADIAYRAIKLNPHLGENAILEAEGIVLIDEIDMHLHPKWQKIIVTDLKKTFPKIQFIATTHSPFIVQSLKADELINLDTNKISYNPDTLSLEENALFMGVEDAKSNKFEKKEKLANEYLKLLDEENPSQDAILKMDDLLLEFSDDPVFIAKLKIEKLARLGKL